MNVRTPNVSGKLLFNVLNDDGSFNGDGSLNYNVYAD